MTDGPAFLQAAPKGGEATLSPAVQAAWERYERKVAALRQHVYSWRAPLSPQRQLQAHDVVAQAQAYVYNSIMAPRTDHPRFYLHNHFEANVYSLVFPCADFNYRVAYLDSHHTYRVWGRTGTSRMVEFQIGAGPIRSADPARRRDRLPTSVNRRLEDLETAADGTFEITLGGPPTGGNHLPLDPSYEQYTAYAREAFYDWAREEPAELHIEVVDGPPAAPFLLDEQAFIGRLQDMGNQLTYLIEFGGTDIVDLTLAATGQRANTFAPSVRPNNSGVNATADFSFMVHDVDDDTALVLDLPAPTAPYWNITLADPYLRTTDYVHHQSSTNGHQARVDADGRIRLVLSLRDPGVRNWLDPVGFGLGVAQLRQYYTADPVRVQVTAVPLADLPSVLPADTAVVTAVERAGLVRARRTGRLRTYGY